MVIEGVVTEGRKLGRELGFPTANVAIDSCVVERGIYRSVVTLAGGETYDGVTNIGVNPTVGDEVAVRSESHLFGFDGDLYGQIIRVELCEKLRDEMRFSSIDELKAQIEKDVALAKSFSRK